MKTNLFLHQERGPRNPKLQNVPANTVTQRPSEGTPGCNCDRWGHPSPDCVEHNVKVQPSFRLQYFAQSDFVNVGANKRLLMISKDA